MTRGLHFRPPFRGRTGDNKDCEWKWAWERKCQWPNCFPLNSTLAVCGAWGSSALNSMIGFSALSHPSFPFALLRFSSRVSAPMEEGKLMKQWDRTVLCVLSELTNRIVWTLSPPGQLAFPPDKRSWVPSCSWSSSFSPRSFRGFIQCQFWSEWSALWVRLLFGS